ncbi:hypothetical protein EV143_104133 [Flavobacterium chryseum]|uniref:hypothetical protein n=1 Tax=Flavobacterium sp. P3160 TaxID=2512113 RepID=UPI0010616A72|nr:hypothetical protein [Flavobacterium sp. P3160]TDO77369.1 hypothetical protein EV143_104133 [Flavobacterium sp. P3160]
MEKINLTIALFFMVSVQLLAQCEVKNRILPDGTLMYYFDPADFYISKSKSLKINIESDKEHFFIALRPFPFPFKDEGKKIKDDLIILLADHKEYKLSHYDTQYRHNDSVMQVLYLMNDKDVEAFSKFEAVKAKINMKGTEFVRDYNFKLHKDAIMQQLNCFLKEEKDN